MSEDEDHQTYDGGGTQAPLDRHDTGLILMVAAVWLGLILAGAYAWHQGAFWVHTEPTHNCK